MVCVCISFAGWILKNEVTQVFKSWYMMWGKDLNKEEFLRFSPETVGELWCYFLRQRVIDQVWVYEKWWGRERDVFSLSLHFLEYTLLRSLPNIPVDKINKSLCIYLEFSRKIKTGDKNSGVKIIQMVFKALDEIT